MNRLELEVKHQPNEHFGSLEAVRILIDGQDVLELLKAYESPLATQEGNPGIAGGYAGIPAQMLLEALSQSSREKATLLGCECGVIECWPLLARVELLPQTVVWSEFEQPFRRESWSYAGFGPFVFERQAYEAELQKLH